MFATVARQSGSTTAFSDLHKQYVMNLYRRFLRDSLNWRIRRDAWRADASYIRAQFEHNRHVRNPRELATILNRAEEQLASRQHPDPYKRTYPVASLSDIRSPDVCGRYKVVRTTSEHQTNRTGSGTCLYVACSCY